MASKNEDKVLAGAAQVFQRYGFRKTTMGDLADAAQMSRPALYLVFPSKADVFAAVVGQVFAATLEEAQAAVASAPGPREQLLRAFEIWCVRPYEQIQVSPDSRDLLESSYAYAPDATAHAFAAFAELVAGVLTPLTAAQKKATGAEPPVTAEQIAELMGSAVLGFKATAKDATALRAMVARLVTLVLTGVGSLDAGTA